MPLSLTPLPPAARWASKQACAASYWRQAAAWQGEARPPSALAWKKTFYAHVALTCIENQLFYTG